MFLSRSGADKPEAAEIVFHLRDAGASVEVFCADAGDEKVVADIVSTVSSKTPIRGVVHAAMVLQVCEKHSKAEISVLISRRMLCSRECHTRSTCPP